jgi:hypothetical protein
MVTCAPLGTLPIGALALFPLLSLHSRRRCKVSRAIPPGPTWCWPLAAPHPRSSFRTRPRPAGMPCGPSITERGPVTFHRRRSKMTRSIELPTKCACACSGKCPPPCLPPQDSFSALRAPPFISALCRHACLPYPPSSTRCYRGCIFRPANTAAILVEPPPWLLPVSLLCLAHMPLALLVLLRPPTPPSPAQPTPGNPHFYSPPSEALLPRMYDDFTEHIALAFCNRANGKSDAREENHVFRRL